MNEWVLLMLAAQSIWAVCTIIDKVVISKGHIASPFVYITLNGFMNVFALLLIPFLGIEILPLKQMLAVAAYGIFHTGAVISYYAAVSHDEISRIKIFEQLGPILTYILAFIVLGEFLTKGMLIGFLFFLGAGLLVSFRRQKKTIVSRAVPFLLLSMALGSFSAIAGKHIFNTTGFWNAFLLLRISGFFALFVLIMPRIRNDFIATFRLMPLGYKKLMSFKMIIDFSAFTFAGYAVTKAPVSLLAAFAGAIMPILVFLLALVMTRFYPSLLREDISEKALITKFAAILLIVAGIVFVSI